MTAVKECALVTGSARRIGRAIALDLGMHGWRVAVHYRGSEDEALELVAEIGAVGGKAAALGADLAVADEVSRLVERAATALGPVTCLVNNASEFEPDTIGTLTAQTWERHLAVNLKAPVLLSQALVRQLPDGATGNVVNIIDQRVWRPTAEFFSYTISKAGLWTATRTLAQALAPRVRVNAVGPGPVLQSVYQTEAEFAAEADATLLGRGPEPEDIAAAVRFILDMPAMTGQMIVLDGGQHLG